MKLRRVVGAMGAAALLAVALPALPANAVPSTATLLAGGDVLPGIADYSISIRNTDTNLLMSAPINAVRFTLPTVAGVQALPADTVQQKAPAGWTVKTANGGPGGQQTYLYEATGSGIARNSEVVFSFPTKVVAPASSDLTGTIRVTTGTDRGTGPADPATGSLSTTVRILEVLPSRVTAPEGVAGDQTATAGQRVTLATTVRNYAAQSVTVTPTLDKGAAADVVGAPSPTSALVASGASTTFTRPVDLAGGSADRVSTFTTGATATGAEAVKKPNDIGVQAPATLTLDGASFSPRALRSDGDPAFRINGNVGGTAALTQLAGTLDFGQNRVPLTASSLAKGSGSYTFSQTADLVGTDGKYAATPALTALDQNDFSYAPLAVVVTDPQLDVLLDNLGIEVISELIPANGLDTVKSGDALGLKVTVDDAAATLSKATLVTDDGKSTDVTSRLTRSADGLTYTGSVNGSFDTVSESVRLTAEFVDAASNSGKNFSGPVFIDNITPEFFYAQTITPTQILVRLRDFDNAGNKLTAAQKASAASKPVFGGCTPGSWSVNGELLVRSVTYPDGSACQNGAKLPNNELVLELLQPKDQDYTTNVTYTPGRPFSDPARDQVVNNALSSTVATAIGIAPAAPTVVSLVRGTSSPAADEPATFDDGSYFTRFAGQDLLLTFGGGRVGYSVEVFDEAGTRLSTSKIGDAEDDTTIVALPEPSAIAEKTYVRKVRLVNTVGIASADLTLNVVYDVTKLGLTTVQQSGRNVTVGLNDKVWSGSDNAFDWAAYKLVNGVRDYYPATSVTPSEDGRSRVLGLAEDTTGITGAEYVLLSSSGVRYLDRAGNPLENNAPSTQF